MARHAGGGVQKQKTGITGLDLISNGGFTRGRSSNVSGILSGNPVHVAESEAERVASLFQDPEVP